MPFLEDLYRSLFGGDEYYVEPLERPIDPRLSDWEITAQRNKERKYRKGLDDRPEHWMKRAWESAGKDEFSGLEAPPLVEVEALQQYSGEKDARAMINDLASAVKERVTPPAPEPEEVEQRRSISGTTPIYEDYDKGIAVGGDPNKSAADILLNIRAQARAKGRGGSLRGGKPTPEDFAASMSPTGGGMTYVQDSPELRQREEDLKEWLAGGALRDAEYAMSPEMSRRDPAGANRASDVLVGLQREKTIRDEQKRRDEATDMLSRVAGRSGKIPADEAMRIAAQNPSLAPLLQNMVGRTREQVASRIRSDMAAAQEMALNGMSQPGNPAAMLLQEAAIKMQPMLSSFEARLNNNEDPEAVWEDYERAKLTLTNMLMQDKRFSAFMAPPAEPGGAPQAGQ